MEIDILCTAPLAHRVRTKANQKCTRKRIESDLLFMANTYSSNRFRFVCWSKRREATSDWIVQGLLLLLPIESDWMCAVWRRKLNSMGKVETIWQFTDKKLDTTGFVWHINSLCGNGWMQFNSKYWIIEYVLVCCLAIILLLVDEQCRQSTHQIKIALQF